MFWEPYEPTQEQPWDRSRVVHLFRRCVFGAGVDEIDRALTTGPRDTVRQLVEGTWKTGAGENWCWENSAES